MRSLRAISVFSGAVFLSCAGTELTTKGQTVRLANREQQTTFKLNDLCRQAPSTISYRDLNDARNLAALNGYNVVQVLFENAYYKTGQARMWQCPADVP
jgi:hypothetical protein